MQNNTITGKNILVSGGTGFIGKHLVNRLAAIGNKVRVLARKAGNLERLHETSNVSFFSGDLSDVASLKQAVNGIDIIYHLAAKLHVPLNSKDPELYKTNVEGTKNLLDAGVSKAVPSFVFFSSAAVMFGNKSAILDETTPCNPTIEYGKSKFLAEKLVLEYGERYNFSTVILRPVVVYGEGERGNVIKMIDSIQKRTFHIIGSGKTIRSLVSVKNVVEAALLVTENPKANGQIYVLTDGDNLTIKDMALTISSKLNVPLSPIHIPKTVALSLGWGCEMIEKLFKINMPLNRDLVRRLTTDQVCSSQKIQQELGFVPLKFEKGIHEMINSYFQ